MSIEAIIIIGVPVGLLVLYIAARLMGSAAAKSYFEEKRKEK